MTIDLLLTKLDALSPMQRSEDPTTALVVLAVLLVVAALVFFITRMSILRVRKTSSRSADLNSIMNQALTMDELYVLEYDLVTNNTRNLYGNLLHNEFLTSDELTSSIGVECRQKLREMVSQMISENIEQCPLSLNYLDIKAEPDKVRWRYVRGHAMLERDKENRPVHLLCTFKDETRKMEEEMKNEEVAQKYFRVFDTNIIAMSFYDKDGWLVNVNQKMRELCDIDEKGSKFFWTSNLFEVPVFRDDLERHSPEDFYVCQRMYYPEMGMNRYLEVRVRQVVNDDGLIVFYVVTTRDVTDERAIYMEQVRNDRELQEAGKAIREYESELRYLLEQSDMYVWRSNTAKRMIEFSRSLRNIEFSISLDDYLQFMFEEDRHKAALAMVNVGEKGNVFSVMHHFHYTPIDSSPQWYAISGMPVTDDDGHVVGHFGVLRKATALMQAQEKLRQETYRAENSGMLKSVFLANMTHEIRTPLNAIVGFSDLLPMIEDDNEKRELVRIIRNNCDMLLRLINDILEASDLSSKPMEITPEDVDFAQSFNDICQTLAQRVQDPNVTFIKDNPYTTLPVHIDNGRMQQVITNFVTNAVKYTKEGHIKVGYRVEERFSDESGSRQGIYMYCEDTGAGIPKDKQMLVFERFVKLNDFVQGTGLGLAICKNIADRCGGNIGVFSEGEGKGSTFWIWIPTTLIEQ